MKKNRVARAVLFTIASPGIWLMIVGRAIRLGLIEIGHQYRHECQKLSVDADFIYRKAGQQIKESVEDFQDQRSKNPDHSKWERDMNRKGSHT